MKNSNRTIKYLVIVGIYIAVIVLIVIFALLPKLSELAKSQNDLEKAKQELVDTTNKRTTLDQLSKDKSRIDLVNSVTLEYLPKDPDTSDFVIKVEALAKQLNIVVSNFSFTEVKAVAVKKTDTEDTTSKSSTSNTEKSTETAAKPKAAPQNSSEFTMLVSAEYGQILQFLEKIETFPRVNVIDSVSVAGYNKTKNTITLKAVGRIFYGN